MSPALKQCPPDGNETFVHADDPVNDMESPETTIHLFGDAAEQLKSLEASTGQPAESVLAMSLGLLETLIDANQHGRQMMLVSRFGFPLRRVVLPCS